MVAFSQDGGIQRIGDKFKQFGGSFRNGSSGNDSLQHRDKNEDSITISFRYLDSTRSYKLDSSIGDFTRRFPIPATYIYLGNAGNAAKSLLFSPNFNAGFDPGLHAFDNKWSHLKNPEKYTCYYLSEKYVRTGDGEKKAALL